MNGLILNGKHFSHDWIIANSKTIAGMSFSENEKTTMVFCSEWLSGVDRFIVHTSGSTGEPKPITLTREQMTHSARMTGEALNLRAGDRALVCLSPNHIAGLMMLVRCFVLDLEMTIVEPSSAPFATLDLRDTPSFEFTALMPLQLQSILSNPYHIAFLNAMKAVLVGGVPVSIALRKEIEKLNAPVYQTFGMTETVSHIALRRVNGPDASEMYHTLPGVEIGCDARGCLTIQSAVTEHRRIVTNDVIELLSPRNFRWLGRVDNIINSGGVKVQTEKIEAAIEQTLDEMGFAHHEFFVAGKPDEKYHEVVVAVFGGRRLSSETAGKLKTLLQKKLTKYETPKEILFVDSMILTSSGKIDRRASMRKALS
jgi:O-succinylbenzoic acid--CoA ligase